MIEFNGNGDKIGLKGIKKNRLVLENFINVFILSVLTGLFAGVVVTFYNVFAELGEKCSAELYARVFASPAFVPLLLLGLAAGGILIGTLVRFVPMIRGSGIPQIEGAARGIIRFKWYVTMCSMFAASLACVFMGLSAGAEGPSLELGGCAGSAVATVLRRNQLARRLQIAGGASAGLAVAFNAPFTGMVFALEEAFRSFSPHVFVCSAVSVIVALFTRNAIRPALSFGGTTFGVGYAFTTYAFNPVSPADCLWFALASVVVSLFGVLFYHLVFLSKKLFSRVTFLKGTGKYVIPFALAGAFGLISVYSMGGGHAFIEALGGGGEIEVFSLNFTLSLLIIVLIRLVATVLNMGCGVPCGVFIPMLALGAGAGAVLSQLFMRMGMDPAAADYLILVCMAAFFTCVVKAPITGLVMIFELTGQFVNFLPALMGVAIGYLVATVCRIHPIYEKCLDMYIEEEKLYERVKKEVVTVEVLAGSRADGEKIRSIIWPTNGLVQEIICPDGVSDVADGEYILRAGQKIVFEGETDDIAELREYLYSIVGRPPE